MFTATQQAESMSRAQSSHDREQPPESPDADLPDPTLDIPALLSRIQTEECTNSLRNKLMEDRRKSLAYPDAVEILEELCQDIDTALTKRHHDDDAVNAMAQERL